MIENHKTAFALIEGVQKATPPGGNERDVVTLITRPMWRLWNRLLAQDEELDPTDWEGPQCTRRIYGSETVIVESDEFYAVSFACKLKEIGE